MKFVQRNPVDDLKLLTIIGADKITKTGLKYDAWLKAMKKEVGPQYEQILEKLWEHSQNLMNTGTATISYKGQNIVVNSAAPSRSAIDQQNSEKPTTRHIVAGGGKWTEIDGKTSECSQVHNNVQDVALKTYTPIGEDNSVKRGEQKRMNKLKGFLKIWIIPALFLLILVWASSTRWEYTATHTTSNNHVLKWKTDRWTGNVWLEDYTASGYKEQPLAGSWYSRTSATNTGNALIFGFGVWFMWSFIVYLWPRFNRDKASRESLE